MNEPKYKIGDTAYAIFDGPWKRVVVRGVALVNHGCYRYLITEDDPSLGVWEPEYSLAPCVSGEIHIASTIAKLKVIRNNIAPGLQERLDLNDVIYSLEKEYTRG